MKEPINSIENINKNKKMQNIIYIFIIIFLKLFR